MLVWTCREMKGENKNEAISQGGGGGSLHFLRCADPNTHAAQQ